METIMVMAHASLVVTMLQDMKSTTPKHNNVTVCTQTLAPSTACVRTVLV